MEKEKLEYWAGVLNNAKLEGRPVAQLSQQLSRQISQQLSEASKFAQSNEANLSFSRSDAYGIQERQLVMQQNRGEIQIGWKMGLTSEAKRKQMNLDSPLYGFLTNKMQVQDQGIFSLKGSIHPKIEPEIAFLIEKDLQGSVTREDVLKSCGAVAAALEILDSRYEQFQYFSMEDVIADNSSSSHFIIGPWKKDFQNINLQSLSMSMSVDGQVMQKGISSDISGDPVVSVIQLCELLAERGQKLKAGSIVLAGAATVAEMLKPNQKVNLQVDSLPSVSVQIIS